MSDDRSAKTDPTPEDGESSESSDGRQVISQEDFRRQSRRSVLTGLLAMAAGGAAWNRVQTQETDLRIPKVLRDGHEFNEALWSALYRENHLAQTFDRSESSELRVNGRHGIRTELVESQWSIEVQNSAGEVIGNHVLDDIQALPKVEMTVEHKCVEGWSHIVTWGGARFADFYELYADRLGATPPFVRLETPDSQYYVGLDMASMLHPQTLLAYELQGEPLSEAHGAPVRLTTPIKYGTKNIKRIGLIRFADQQPTDYWGDRGYDWYAAL